MLSAMVNDSKKHVLVLEDSKKGGFGGGQKGTLEVIDSLKSDYSIFLGDTSNTTRFAKEVESRGLDTLNLHSTGRLSTGDTASFSMHWFEYLIFPFHLIWNVIGICRFLKKSNCSRHNTILYAAHKKRLVESWILNKLCGYRFIFHIRTYDSRRSPFFFLVKRWMRSAVINIAVSQSVKENVDLDNIEVIPNPLTETVRSNPRKPRKPFIVGVFASLLGWKGIDVFMKSHAFLKNGKSIRFEIFGEGPLYGDLKKFESENVCLMGYTNNVSGTLESSVSLVCVPSIKPESFGRVSLEAFAYGIPAIASDLGGQREIIDNGSNGFLVEPGNPVALAAAIDKLYSDSNLYHEFSLSALDKAQRFSYEVYAKKIIRLFNGVFK